MKQYRLHILFLAFVLTFGIQANGQTFFEGADGDGVIAFRRAKASQIKISPTSTAITYGYYSTFGKSTKDVRGLFNLEAQVKPNDEGMATLIKSGKIQTGVKMSGAIGFRLNDSLLKPTKKNEGSFLVIDVYAKPELHYTSHRIYDTTRVEQGLEALYRQKKLYAGVNFLVNSAFSIFETCNVFLGVQIGWKASSNVDDLNDVTIQTTSQFIGQPTTQVKSGEMSAKEGIYENVNTTPFKVDLIFDTGHHLGTEEGANNRVGIFTYFRNDLRYNKNQNRLGLGLCLLNERDPSKVFLSLGYELPMFGKGVDSEASNDLGIVFTSIGYKIL